MVQELAHRANSLSTGRAARYDFGFLEAAFAGAGDFVVNGDAALLRLENHHRIQIVRPA